MKASVIKENRHLAEWRFSPFILIVTTYPRIWNVKVIGIGSPPFGGRSPNRRRLSDALSNISYHIRQDLTRGEIPA